MSPSTRSSEPPPPCCAALLRAVTSRHHDVSSVQSALAACRSHGVGAGECRGRVGGSPLVWAARAGHAGAVGLLLSPEEPGRANGGGRGATTSSSTLDSTTPSRTPSLPGRPCTANDCDDLGLSALSHASQEGWLPCADALLSAGADASSVDCFGLSPLHKAAAFGHDGVCQRLCRGGADPNVPASASITAPLAMEAEASRGVRPLHCIARGAWAVPDAARRQRVIRALLVGGADPGLRDDDGDTPLHYAAAGGDWRSCWTLVREGGGFARAGAGARNHARCVPADLVPLGYGDGADAGAGDGGPVARAVVDVAARAVLKAVLRVGAVVLS